MIRRFSGESEEGRQDLPHDVGASRGRAASDVTETAMLKAVLYRFEHFELDTARFALRAHSAAVALERQVFALLRLLIAPLDRLVGREEILAEVGEGRSVSEAAVAS